jgi:hypothetical protein
VSQITFRIDNVTHELFQPRGIGKTSIALALPDDIAVAGDLKYAAGSGMSAT